MREINDDRPPTGWNHTPNDDASDVTVADPDPVAHSPAGLAILREQGVEAYEHKLAVARSVVELARENGEDPLALLDRLRPAR